MPKKWTGLETCEKPLWEGVGPAGVAACSFSAESTAVIDLLKRLLVLFNSGLLKRHAGDGAAIRVRIVLDAKSFADALHVGPLNQIEWFEVRAYELLAELQTRCNVDVHFVVIFSHVGVLRNEYVDKLCEKFMKEVDRTGRPLALFPVPMRLCDCVNIRMRNIWPYAQHTECPFGRRNPLDNRKPLLLRPAKLNPNLGLSRSDEIRLFRLRTLCAPSIGTVIHDHAPEPCRQCGARVMKRADAVVHAFECGAPDAVEMRDKLIISLESVPDDDYAEQVLKYIKLFEKPAEEQEENEEPDSDGDEQE
jgi:hypothetical protein